MKRNYSLKNRRGMTLVELSVVVLILGAIIALVAFNIRPPKDDMAALKLKKDSQELQIALEQYAGKYGKMPTEEQGLSALVEKPTSGDVPEDYKPILNTKAAIIDPWKTEYKLKIDSTGDYEIITLGMDKKEGGEGQNADFNILKPDGYPKQLQK
jgi:general secretion pathway protein G